MMCNGIWKVGDDALKKFIERRLTSFDHIITHKPTVSSKLKFFTHNNVEMLWDLDEWEVSDD